MSATPSSLAEDFFESNSVLVASIIAPFLGVQSLVRLSACRKAYRALIFQPEVTRRQQVFAAYEEQVRSLLPGEDGRVDSPAKILEAISLHQAARDLVDAELDWVDSPVWTEPDEDTKRKNLVKMRKNPFYEQIRRLAETDDYPPSHPAFFVLPRCFYISPQATATSKPQTITVTKRHIAAAKHYTSWIWGAEDHMQPFYEMGFGFDPYYADPKYPFRKFEHPLSQFFLECMHDLVLKLKADKVLKAMFRHFARKLALSRPGATDCLHYVIFHADAEDNDEAEMSSPEHVADENGDEDDDDSE